MGKQARKKLNQVRERFNQMVKPDPKHVDKNGRYVVQVFYPAGLVKAFWFKCHDRGEDFCVENEKIGNGATIRDTWARND